MFQKGALGKSMQSQLKKKVGEVSCPEVELDLGHMKDSYTITLKEDAKPFAISVPRKVPLPLYQKTKDELDRML